MTQSSDDIIEAARAWIVMEFLPGELPDSLDESTPLITSGILDSLATLDLVAFLETQYGIEFEASEVDASRLGTLADIERLVDAKRAARGGTVA